MNISELIQTYGMTIRTEGDLSILRSKMDEGLPPYVKGLIFNGEGVVCPGMIIPEIVDTIPDDNEGYSYSYAYDGVIFRLFYHGDKWYASTTGQITATNGWGGAPFNTLFEDVKGQIDYARLNRDYCYYVVMEHTGHMNIIPHLENRVILQAICTRTAPFPSIDLTDENVAGFQNVAPYIKCPNEVGLNIYKDGKHYRWENPRYKAANALKPNLPDIFAHWVNLLVRPQDDGQGLDLDQLMQNAESKIREYVDFFPWAVDRFNYMRERFLATHFFIVSKIQAPRTRIPSRLMKFTRELTAEERTPEGVLRKLLKADEKYLMYLLNPYNKEDVRPEVVRPEVVRPH